MNSKKRTFIIKRKAETITRTVPETAKLIRTDINNIRWLIANGYIKTLKLGDTKIPLDEIRRFIKYSIDNDVDWNQIIPKDRDSKKKVTL